jgi:hypothetical protein
VQAVIASKTRCQYELVSSPKMPPAVVSVALANWSKRSACDKNLKMSSINPASKNETLGCSLFTSLVKHWQLCVYACVLDNVEIVRERERDRKREREREIVREIDRKRERERDRKKEGERERVVALFSHPTKQ